MLKVAYISPTYFANVDISFIHEMQKYCDLHYFAITHPNYGGCAIAHPTQITEAGIYDASNIEQMDVFKDIIDLTKTKLVVRNHKSSLSWPELKVTHRLKKMLQDGQYDIIHFTMYFHIGELELLQLRDKSILSVHDPISHSNAKNARTETLRRIMFRNLSHFVVFNNVQTKEFIETYHLQNKHVYESALSVYSYLNIYKPKKSQTYQYILYTGRIYSYKGIEYLLSAMQIVHQTYPDLKLIVAGGGKYYFDIQPYLNCDYIELRNHFMEDDELADLIANTECIVCPYTDATQSGVIMSAYAFDKPCIVTNVGGLPDMVGHGEYGLIVPPRDIQALADAICQMIEHPTLRYQFAQRIHDTYSNGGKSWKDIVANFYTNIYTKISKTY